MNETNIMLIFNKYKNNEIKNYLETNLLKNITKYLEYLEMKKSKISSKEKLSINKKLILIEAKIKSNLELLDK